MSAERAHQRSDRRERRGQVDLEEAETATAGLEVGLMAVSTVVAVGGIGLAFFFFLKNPQAADDMANRFAGLHRLLVNKYYVDELYAAVIVRPLVWLSENVFWKVVDVEAIDGTVNGIAHGATAVGDTVRRTQSGNTRSYAVWVVVGALAVIIILFWPALHPIVSPVQGAVTK